MGPSAAQVRAADAARVAEAGIQVVRVDDRIARSLAAGEQRHLFSESLGAAPAPAQRVGAGDVVAVSIWEAPPALLFGGTPLALAGGSTASSAAALPEQVVDGNGTITVPFAGSVLAAGRTTTQIESAIAERLKGKANQPQVVVRVVRNVSANVTVVGEVANSIRMPLTPQGERLLDAIAAAGGVRQPVHRISVQVTRGDRLATLPLQRVIQDPRQNVPLQPGDVVTALHQPFSLSVLGATGRNDELAFEAQGITLAQALARAGGLVDSRADALGVFVFRFEDPQVLGLGRSATRTTPEGKVPVVYQVDLKDPASFFVAQTFPMRDRDVMYVANAPAAELQKFLNVLVSAVYPIVNVGNATR